MAHSKELRPIALATIEAENGNISAAARDLNIPERTINSWNSGERANTKNDPAFEQLCEEKKNDLITTLEKVAHKLAGGITEEKIANAKLNDIAVSLAIAIDKLQLLKGEATNITHSLQLSPEQRKARIEALRSQLKAG